MHRDVACLVALDLVLGIITCCMMDIPFVIHILGMHSNDRAGHPACLRVPADVITDFEVLSSHCAVQPLSVRPSDGRQVHPKR